MEQVEAAKLLKVVKAVYPKHYQNFTEDDMSAALIGWHAVLKPYDFRQALAGLQAYLATDKRGFPPSPGQVIDAMQDAGTADEEPTATEAWSLVKKALRNGLYGSEEEFAKLPQIVQRAVGSADTLKAMAATPSETVNSVEQSHFIAAYNRLIERKKQDAKVPETVKMLLKDGRRAERLGYALPTPKAAEALPEPEAEAESEMSEETSHNIKELLRTLRRTS